MAAVTATEPDTEQSGLEGSPTVGLRAKLPAGAVTGMLLPPGVLPPNEELAVTMWLNPVDGSLIQLLLVSSVGSVAVKLIPSQG